MVIWKYSTNTDLLYMNWTNEIKKDNISFLTYYTMGDSWSDRHDGGLILQLLNHL